MDGIILNLDSRQLNLYFLIRYQSCQKLEAMKRNCLFNGSNLTGGKKIIILLNEKTIGRPWDICVRILEALILVNL